MNLFEKYMFLIALINPMVYWIQGFKIWRKKTVKGVSWPAFFLGFVSNVSWFIHSYIHGGKQMMLGASLCALGNLIILTGYFTYVDKSTSTSS